MSDGRPEIIDTVQAMQQRATGWRAAGQRIGLVPTMGCLHEGHLALVRRARQDCGVLVVSIFVNPTQFGPSEDLASYPRDLERDLQLCAGEGVDVVYHPSAEEMYPEGAQTFVTVTEVSAPLCGVSRPTHFRGVATICAKLFHAVAPHVAVFGAKDYQQLQVIRTMVRDLDFDLQIVGHPTVREADGLAMSSRNVYLDAEQRKQALCLSQALEAAEQAVAGGERDAAVIVAAARAEVEAPSLARVDYVELRDAETLGEITTLQRPVVLALAVFFGKTRLIDNRVLAP